TGERSCGHAAEARTVSRAEPVPDAPWAAERDRTDSLTRRLLDVGQVGPPSAGLPRLLEESVVHDRATARLREPAQEAVLQLGIRASTALDHAGADFAEHVGQREEVRLRRAGGGNPLAHDVEVIHVAPDRDPGRCA